jgi:putative nucleotidyltransferase with HDIG domain
MKDHLKEALRISGIYAGVSALWIFLSDGLVTTFARDPEVITAISMYKGWGFVLVTSIMLFFLLKSRLAALTAASLENERLLSETQRQLEGIQALHNIDTAIIESIADKGVFDLTLDTIMQQLKIDAASILYRNPLDGNFELLSARGVSTTTILAMANCKENSLALRALEMGKPFVMGRLADGASCEARDRLIAEGMRVFCAVPLASKSEAPGVMELFSRQPFNASAEWNEYLAMFVGQVTIAYNNMEMLRKLERSNERLVKAYDATIETLSFALDLKDHGTNWHSKRVTDLTMMLARSMGIEGDRLSQIWRGAMLHDIGKIGIPDSILLKPGALDDEEMAAMRKHTVYAFQMLSRIDYLAQAIDIPYAHHEKWDGSGYPRGLKGENIPLPARIFAVIDVYDALTSDRPYRQAWTIEKALDEIKAQTGRHFDPAVVEAFFALLATEEGREIAAREEP